jgi:hypothetical protein
MGHIIQSIATNGRRAYVTHANPTAINGDITRKSKMYCLEPTCAVNKVFYESYRSTSCLSVNVRNTAAIVKQLGCQAYMTFKANCKYLPMSSEDLPARRESGLLLVLLVYKATRVHHMRTTNDDTI